MGTLLDRYERFRAMTLDLLAMLDDQSLLFTPGPGLGPLWQQFRHLGRVEDNYTAALATGHIVFGPPRRRSPGTTVAELAGYLQDLDGDLREALASVDPALTIRWGAEAVDLVEHIARLVNHELLHHGEMIVYMRLLGRAFPPTWRVWGL